LKSGNLILETSFSGKGVFFRKALKWRRISSRRASLSILFASTTGIDGHELPKLLLRHMDTIPWDLPRGFRVQNRGTTDIMLRQLPKILLDTKNIPRKFPLPNTNTGTMAIALRNAEMISLQSSRKEWRAKRGEKKYGAT
jgi:hypothetical protein